MYRPLAALAAIAALSVAAAPAFAEDGATFSGAGQELELDCNGGGASIEGASNIVTITGNCTSLSIEGADNRVRVQLAAKSAIHVVGASNQVVWTGPAGAKPRLSLTGAGNRVSRAN